MEHSSDLAFEFFKLILKKENETVDTVVATVYGGSTYLVPFLIRAITIKIREIGEIFLFSFTNFHQFRELHKIFFYEGDIHKKRPKTYKLLECSICYLTALCRRINY